MRVENKGLGELMDCMKVSMKEANGAVIKANLNLLGLLAEAIGDPIKMYTKKCFVPCLNFLSNKATLVRADCIAAVNKWAEAIGNPIVLKYLVGQLIVENPELR